MTSEQLHHIIAAGLQCEHLEVDGDGRHWSAVIVSAAFEGKRLIQRQPPERLRRQLIDPLVHAGKSQVRGLFLSPLPSKGRGLG